MYRLLTPAVRERVTAWEFADQHRRAAATATAIRFQAG